MSAPALSLLTQYVKDLSLENPNAPFSLMHKEGKPDIQLNVDVKAQKLSETECEVILHLSADASLDGKKLFVTELSYGGLFSLTAQDEESWRYLSMVPCPTLLFPFARRVLSDATRDAGFPPLMLDPINFAALFERSKAA